MEDCLIIGYDHSSDGTSLVVARNEDGTLVVLNEIRGDAAFGIYHYLTGGAELKNIKDIPKKPIGDLNSVPNYRCPNCNNAIVVYQFDYKYPHCKWCGQAIDWD